MGDVYPGFCGGDGFLPILGQPAASPQPCECALHDPAARPVLDIGGMDDETDHQPDGVDNDVTLAPVDLLSCVEAPNSAAFRGLDRLASLFGGLKSSAFYLFSGSPASDVFRGALLLSGIGALALALYGDSEEWGGTICRAP